MSQATGVLTHQFFSARLALGIFAMPVSKPDGMRINLLKDPFCESCVYVLHVYIIVHRFTARTSTVSCSRVTIGKHDS